MFGYLVSLISGSLAPVAENGGLVGCIVFTAKSPHAFTRFEGAPPGHFWVSGPSLTSGRVGS